MIALLLAVDSGAGQILRGSGGASVTPGFIGIYLADPTGSTNTSTISGQGNAFGSPFVTTTAGTVNRVCVAVAGGSVNPGIYSEDRTTKLSDSSIVTSSGGWTCAILDTTVELLPDTTYFLAAGASGYITYYRLGGGGTSFRNISIGGALTDTIPSSITGGSENANYRVYIYADYL